MPNYTFKNKKTGKITTITMTMDEHEDYVKNNPHMVQEFAAVPQNYRGKINVPNGYKDILKRISKDYPRNNINIP